MIVHNQPGDLLRHILPLHPSLLVTQPEAFRLHNLLDSCQQPAHLLLQLPATRECQVIGIARIAQMQTRSQASQPPVKIPAHQI
jgi:hypothetical protein